MQSARKERSYESPLASRFFTLDRDAPAGYIGSGHRLWRRLVVGNGDIAVTGKLAGKTTNSLTKTGVAGVAITTEPAISGVNIAIDANGAYAVELPVGVYNVVYKKDGFTTANQRVSLVAGQTAARDLALKPAAPVLVKAGSNQRLRTALL